MGITGLIPFLEKASSKINIKEMKGCTVAVDTYCWLHKGAYGCAEKLNRGESTNIHILYCLKYVNMLLSFDVKPILVFDGRHLPAKAETEEKRRVQRAEAKKRAAELLRLGRIEEARVQMRRCIDITHEMVHELIVECRRKNVDCIVAPYEADAQLAYLNKKNIVQYVITEDSDLTLFGAKNIIFKLDLVGNGLLIESNKMHLAMGTKPERYSFEKFRKMCILSGCDYVNSLPGIGLSKACKFILKSEEIDMRKSLKKIPQYLNMRNLVISDDYIEKFLKAEATFKHMYVFDPFARRMVRLNELPENEVKYEILCSNAGSLLDDETAFELALGNLNPFTLNIVDDWKPDYIEKCHYKSVLNQNEPKTNQFSIWQTNNKPYILKRQMKINAFTKVAYPYVDSLENPESNKKDESSIASIYLEKQPLSKKQKKSGTALTKECLDACFRIKEKGHNPFLKATDLVSNLEDKLYNLNQSCDLKPLSKFKRTVIDDAKEVKSRLFLSNTIMLKNLENKIITRDNNNEKENNGNPHRDIEKSLINSECKNISAPASKDDKAEIIMPNSGIYTQQKNLQSKRSTTRTSGSQTNLVMFGFRKKPSLHK